MSEKGNVKGTATSSTVSPEKQSEGAEKVSFQEFVFLMSSQALIAMGSVPNPLTGKTEVDLPGAQRVIDILGMLEKKTQGNLTEAESDALATVLYNLRMRYVDAVQAQAAKKKS